MDRADSFACLRADRAVAILKDHADKMFGRHGAAGCGAIVKIPQPYLPGDGQALRVAWWKPERALVKVAHNPLFPHGLRKI